MVAIIPAAGRGTRMSSVTDGRPKELLPLGGQPILLHVIREAFDAEADEVVVVSSPEKPEIAEFVAGISRVRVVNQAQMRGLGDAIACAEVDDEAIVLLGDCVFQGGSPAGRIGSLLARGIAGCIAVEIVADTDVHRYGIVEINEFNGAVKRILEKPSLQDTPSRWAVAARYGLSRELMVFLMDRALLRSSNTEHEIGITEILNDAVAAGFDMKAVALAPEQSRLDAGSPDGYDAARRAFGG